MKPIWMTALEREQATIETIRARLGGYGFEVAGHFWTDDLQSLAWQAPTEEICKRSEGLWLIVTNQTGIARSDVRYGLSLLALAVHAHAPTVPPTILLYTEAAPAATTLPTALEGATVMSTGTPAWEAKLVAIANTSRAVPTAEYFLDAYGDRQIGQWFEVGPAGESWEGVMFGVEGAAINLHAVGKRGKIPNKTVLNYAQRDIKLALDDKEYSAWAVRNPIGADESYFVRVEGYPNSLVFGPYAEADAAELYFQRLK